MSKKRLFQKIQKFKTAKLLIPELLQWKFISSK